MCGVVGIYSFNGKPLDEDLLIRMRDTMAHRGPDGAGTGFLKTARLAWAIGGFQS